MNAEYRNGVLLVAGGLLTLGVLGLHTEPAPKTVVIATMGTSLTSGDSAVGGPWQPDLKAELEQASENKFAVYNFGIGGARSRYDQDPTHSGFSVLPQVAALRADVVTIEYAMNDCVDVSIEQSAANLSQIIDTIRAARSDTRIILMTMNPTVGVLPYRDDLDVYNGVYRDLALSKNVELLDAYPAWGTPTVAQIPDSIHPTNAATREILVPLLVAKILGNP